MSLARTKRLLIALLAQVTLCLSLAPVLAAQVPTQKKESKGTESPTGDGLTILAARDAANGRPEDVTETERSQIRRVGRVSTRRFGREETRWVQALPIALAPSTPSPGTPGEGWGGGSRQPPNNERGDIKASPQHSALSAQHFENPTLTLPRSTGGGNIAKTVVTCAKAHPKLRSLFLGDCIQPTGPPPK